MDELDVSILQGIASSQKIALDFCNQFNEDSFSTDRAKLVGKVFTNYVKIYKNRPTLKALLEQYNTNDNIVSVVSDFWNKHISNSYDNANYNFDIEKFKKRFKSRKLEAIKGLITQEADVEACVKIIKSNISNIDSIGEKKIFERKTIKDYLPEFANNYSMKKKDETVGRGIMTGYSFLDHIKNGIQCNDLIVISGETGSGKSIMLNNMAIQVWMQQNTVDTPPDQYTKGYNVVYVSLEMSKDDCFQRTMCRLADVRAYDLRDAKLSDAEVKSIGKVGKFIKKYPYIFEVVDVPRGLSVERLELILDEIKNEYNPDVIFVDYLTLMDDDSADEDWLKLDKLAGKMHEFTRVHNIPVVTGLQLTRINPKDKQAEDKRIGLHRIGRSSQMAHHCTLIIQIESRDDEDNRSDFIYHIIKNRHGESNKSHTVYKDFSRLSILDKPYQPELQNNWNEIEDISGEVADLSDLLKED